MEKIRKNWSGEYEMEGFCLIVHHDRKRAEKDRKDREMSVGRR